MVKIVKGGKEIKDLSQIKLPAEVIRIIKTSVQN